MQKGHIPKSLKELIQDDDATEGKADMEVEIPTNKLKRVIGPGGDIIRGIEKQSKCRIQHTKNDQEMGLAFGASYKTRVDAQSQTITLKLFGSQDACARARELIMNAVENKEQKAKQRAKEYEKKKEEKRAQRQIYHLRHARDYEALGVPLGTPKADIKVAFRKLAMIWHPDKNPSACLKMFCYVDTCTYIEGILCDHPLMQTRERKLNSSSNRSTRHTNH